MTKLIKWPGSKANAAKTVGPILLSVIDPDRHVTLIEPFLGSGAMTQWVEGNVSSLSARANEYNYALAQTFGVLRHSTKEELEELVAALNEMSAKWAAVAYDAPVVPRTLKGGKVKNIQWSQEAEDFFESLRSSLNTFNSTRWGYSLNVAPLFLLFNRIAFNGLYRESKKSGLNVPVGRNNKGFYNKTPDWSQVLNQPWLQRLTGFDIKHQDFATFLDNITVVNADNTVLYVDPPYIGKFSQYNKDGFGLDRHVELITACERLHRSTGIPVVYSNSGGGKQLLERYGCDSWEVTEFYSKTSVSCGSDKGKLDEVVGVLK